jgi:hypothetical protein
MTSPRLERGWAVVAVIALVAVAAGCGDTTTGDTSTTAASTTAALTTTQAPTTAAPSTTRAPTTTAPTTTTIPGDAPFVDGDTVFAVGDCFVTESTQGSARILVDCGETHDAEVIATGASCPQDLDSSDYDRIIGAYIGVDVPDVRDWMVEHGFLAGASYTFGTGGRLAGSMCYLLGGRNELVGSYRAG